jgi:hypothetical protein
VLNNELNIIDEEIRKAKLVKNDIDYIKQEMLKETNFSGDISDFVDLLIDKVYVSKIDNDRNRIKLDVILKFGNSLEINASKNRNGGFEFSFVDNECLLSADNGEH